MNMLGYSNGAAYSAAQRFTQQQCCMDSTLQWLNHRSLQLHAVGCLHYSVPMRRYVETAVRMLLYDAVFCCSFDYAKAVL
jgi:hypothetical protein